MHQSSNEPDQAGLGRFIRERRLELGLTQTQLAQRAGFVQERISLLENGKYGMPSLGGLATLAAALEVSLGQLIHAAGYVDDTGSLPAGGEAAQADERFRSVITAETSHEQASRILQQSHQLSLGLRDLYIRLAATAAQLMVADDLRRDLACRRQTFAHLISELQQRSSAHT